MSLYLMVVTSGNAQTIEISGPAGSGEFGHSLIMLPNGNYVVADPFYDDGGVPDVGAIYLYDGLSHTLISKLTGSSENDQVGLGGITALANGHFVVASQNWDDGSVMDVGAVTWVNGTTGINGVVNSANSLIGSTSGDLVGAGGVTALSNGNYLVTSLSWSNAALEQSGAVTWGNGVTGIVGVVSSDNSLVSNPAVGLEPGLLAPMIITLLPGGNYLVGAFRWNNGLATNAGSLTWANASTGITGPISAANSLVGTTKDDGVGIYVTILSNGNYVTRASNWDFAAIVDAGAVTWGSAEGGLKGTISSSNSLLGSQVNDHVGRSVTALTNGNYVVGSPDWDNGTVAAAGAVTLCNGVTGTTGFVSSSNSLTGSRALDQVGSNALFGGIFALPNGNYLVRTPTWDNGVGAQDAGAVTWGSGTSGVSGPIDDTNSLIGTVASENLGSASGGGVTILSNGNYVVANAFWNNGPATKAGAVTWGNGTTGIAGTINSSNSMVGSRTNDQVGSSGVTALSNGNYVVCSPLWDNGTAVDAGSVRWGNGTTGSAGVISPDNSLVGSTTNDQIGNGRVTALSNGNYVVNSYSWDNGAIVNVGAITWGNGTTGINGAVSSANSFVGSTASDQVGFNQPRALSSGNYVMTNYFWDNGSLADAGAVTWADGLTGVSGTVTAANSLIGTTAGDRLGFGGLTELSNGNYLIRSTRRRNGGLVNAGAITWANGSTGITGVVSEANSLIGTAADDQLGSGGILAVENGNYIINSPDWDNGAATDIGAVTFGNGTIGTNGPVSECNSVPGGSGKATYNPVYNYIIVNQYTSNKLAIFNPSGMALAESSDESVAEIVGKGTTPMLVDSECKIIATIASTGSNAVSGRVEAKTWLEADEFFYGGKPYVARHYQITPDHDPDNSTGIVTLYFTQQDFDYYNSTAGTDDDLPSHGADATGKANLLITKLVGTSSDQSGLPSTYSTEGAATINPEDEDIIWNPSLERWEVSFEVTGFSGFFVQGASDPLPVQLISFEAGVRENDAVLSWLVADAENFSHFELQKSSDARQFKTFGRVAFTGAHKHYEAIDKNLVQEASEDGKLYYRLKMIDTDGSFAYSKIEQVAIPRADKYIYPNPASGKFWLNAAELSQVALLEIIGGDGKQLGNYSRLFSQGVTIDHLPPGHYLVKVTKKDGTTRVHKLIVK